MSPIVVNDTNIFIDLISVDLLDAFFNLPIDVHTTDFVFNELTEPSQHRKVEAFILQNKLKLKRHSAIEVVEIAEFQSNCDNNVSIADCSVWLYAQKNNYTLLTGDGKLRKSASKSGVDVCGILKIFDLLVEDFKIIPRRDGAEKLAKLYKINNRLPSREIEDRLARWGNLL